MNDDMLYDDPDILEQADCLIDSHHEIYIPQLFVELFKPSVWHLTDFLDENDIDILRKGPDEEYYWDVWDMVLNHAWMEDVDNKRWVLLHDCDLFAIPYIE